MKKSFQQGLLSAMVISLVACGGGSGGGSKKSSTPASSSAPSSTSSSVAVSSSSGAPVSSVSSSSAPANSSMSSSAASNSSIPSLTGIFLDSAVAGIGYRTSPSGKTGFTSAQGEYDYDTGDKVTFFIGDLELPEVDAKGVITPLDIAQTDELTNQVVLNIAILLQSLDSDGDPSNGITVDYQQIAASATAIATFDVSPASFTSSITPLVTAAGNTPVTVEAAQAHLQNTVEKLDTLTAERLVGTWLIEGDDYTAVVAFLDTSRYMTMEVTESEGTNLEVGTYAWNASTGVITASPYGETGNPDLGLQPTSGSYVITTAGEQLFIHESGDEEERTAMTKLTSNSGLVGGWYMADTGVIVLTAFTGTHYLMGQFQPLAEDEFGESGIEYGTYTHNAGTNAFHVTTLVDTNQQWGFSHPCALLDTNGTQWQDANDLSCGPGGNDILQTMARSNSSLTFVSQADTIYNDGVPDPVVFDAVGAPTTKEVIELEVEVTNTVIEANQGQLFTKDGATMQCGLTGFDQVGDTENFAETWVLNPNYGQLSSVSNEKYDEEEVYTDTGTFDLVSSKLTISNPGTKVNLCATGEAQCEGSSVIFYGHNSYTWTADMNLDSTGLGLATGVIEETQRLSWNLGPEVSVCTVRYEVSAVSLE